MQANLPVASTLQSSSLSHKADHPTAAPFAVLAEVVRSSAGELSRIAAV